MKVGYILYNTEKKPCGISRFAQGCINAIQESHQLEMSILGYNYLKLNGCGYVPVLYQNKDTENKYKEVKVLADVLGLDIVHSYYFPLPKLERKKSVLTIHDLAALVNISWFPNAEKTKLFYDCHLRQGADDSDIILADSEYTKLDIIKYYDVPPEKIRVIYPGIYTILNKLHVSDGKANMEYQKISNYTNQDCQTLKKYKIDKEYILSICTVEPRKNLLSLINAYEILRDRQGDYDMKLVLVGRKGWKNDDVYLTSATSKYSSDIIFTEYVEDYELDILYRNALLFVYISYYEGFGLPILEAMEKGVAVLASETTSMPEVGGNAVCYCNPYELESIIHQLDKLLYDDKLRMELRKKAVVQAEKFSYKKMAYETMEVYKELLQE